MMSADEKASGRIRRILVAVDTSPHGQAALEAAVRLAAMVHAELTVLYVENTDLINVPRLSFIREMDALSGELRELEMDSLEEKMRLEAARIRRRLEQTVSRRDVNVKWSFRVARGRVAVELLQAAADADLVSLGSRSHWLGRGPGSTARAVLAQSGKPVMILRRGAVLGNRVCVFFDGTAQSREGLLLAERILENRDGQLCILLRSPTEDAAELREEAASVLHPESRGVHAIRLQTLSSAEVSSHLHGQRCGLLVLPRDRFTLSDGVLSSLVDAAPCPVILIGDV